MSKKDDHFSFQKQDPNQEKDAGFDEFLNDVETEIRLEKYQNLWKKYGKIISTGVTLFLAGIIVLQLWFRYDAQQREKFAKEFIQVQTLIEEGKTDEALPLLKFLAEKKYGAYSNLAQFCYANLLSSKQDEDQAEEQKAFSQIKEAYQKIFSNRKAPQYLQDLSRILYVNTVLKESSQKTQQENEELLSLLDKCSLKNAGFSLLCSEFKGMILFELKRFKEARELFDDISRSVDCPSNMRQRVSLMIQAIQSAQDEGQQAEEVKANS